METFRLELKAMYADHHVVEVRRILLELPGVIDVYASSAFHIVEVQYDPEKLSQDQIRGALEETGYMGELPIPVEAGASVYLEEGKKGYFRHTSVYENIKQGTSFTQLVAYQGRALWPCPGIGTIKTKQLEEE